MIKGGAITTVQMIIFFSFQLFLGGYVYFVISCGGFKNAGLICIRDSLTAYIDSDTKVDKTDKDKTDKDDKEKAAKEKAAKEKAAKEKAAKEKAAKEKVEKEAKEKAAKEAQKKAEEAARQKNKIINTVSAERVIPDELKEFEGDEDVMSVLANIENAIPSVDDFFGGSNNIHNNKIPFILLLILLYLICFK